MEVATKTGSRTEKSRSKPKSKEEAQSQEKDNLFRLERLNLAKVEVHFIADERTYKSLEESFPNLFNGSAVKGRVTVDDCKKLFGKFSNEECQIDALRLAQRLASYNLQQKETLLEIGILDELDKILEEETFDPVLFEALRLISAIVDGADLPIFQAVARSKIIDFLPVVRNLGCFHTVLEATRIHSVVLSTSMLWQSIDLLSVLQENGWVEQLACNVLIDDEMMQRLCLGEFLKVLQKYHPLIAYPGVERDDVDRVDFSKINGGAGRVFIEVLLKILEMTHTLSYSSFAEIRRAASDAVGSFFMSSILCKKLPYLPSNQTLVEASHESCKQPSMMYAL